MEVGTEGFWIEEDGSYTHCRIVDVVDAGTGFYEFESLTTDEENWYGWDIDFIREC